MARPMQGDSIFFGSVPSVQQPHAVQIKIAPVLQGPSVRHTASLCPFGFATMASKWPPFIAQPSWSDLVRAARESAATLQYPHRHLKWPEESHK